MSRWAVILAGGVGSRFWPLSTPRRPKQLLALVTDTPLLSDTVRRLTPLVSADKILILANAAIAGSVAELLPGVPAGNIIAEPRAAGTAPALAWAALEIQRRDSGNAVMLCVHADWAIGDEDGFRRVLSLAADTAEHENALVTVGVVPTRPDPGFGYIQLADAVNGAYRVARFTEKPDVPTAGQMLRDGYLWNSGIFVWRVSDFLGELRTHTPEVAHALAGNGNIESFFDSVKPTSVDEGLLERSGRVLVIPGDFQWDDVGTWAALRRVRPRDALGNALAGDVHSVESNGNVVHAEGNRVVLYGVSDLVVVSREGLTLVTTVERAADLKTLLDSLPTNVRDQP
ncbi:MAG: mannose-1-phosphate guanylyltransferase [Anaerolineae bacterium]|nr:mannose-1-phosphate guanylyltransferase [Gemmatimonadaceae bacterium]